MKKMFKGMAVALAVCCFAGLTACKNEGESSSSTAVDEKVYLQAITGADAVTKLDMDYFLLAEPAVSAQAKNGFSIKGDLQSLYGGEEGYPQAVLVAKNTLIQENSEWVKGFTSELNESMVWLNTATGAEVVAAVGAHMDDPESATSLKAPLLSSAVMARCGVRFTYASACKAEVNGFLTQMRAVNEKAAAMPADTFYWDALPTSVETTTLSREITVCMPDGAPALAMAKLMADDTDSDGVTYKVVATDLIASKVTNKDMEKNADLCVLPVTAASKLLGNGENYTMLGVVTHGNLYLISKEGEALSAENMDSLKGKKIGVLKINEVPGLTLKTVLNKYGLAFEEITNA